MASDKLPGKVIPFERPRRFPADLDRLRARLDDEDISFEESDLDEGLAIAQAAIDRHVAGGEEAKADLLNIRAHRLLAASDTDGALARWAEIVAAYPTYFPAVSMRADLLGKRNDYATALAELDHYVEKAPTDARGYLWRGKIYQAQGDAERALANLRRAVLLDPSSTEAKLSVATALAAKGDKEGAARAFAKAAEEVLPDAESYDMRGLMHFVSGQEELALADYEASLALDPTQPDTVAWRGLLRSRLGRREEALADFNRLISMRPNEARGYWRRGEVLLHLGKPAEALRDLDRAVALGGDERGASHVARGMAQEALGDVKAALASYDEAVTRDPKNVALRSRRFQIFNAREDWQRCRVEVEAVLAQTPDDPSLVLTHARLLQRTGKRKDALAAFTRLLDLDPKNAEAWAERSALQVGFGNTAAAHADMAKAYELNPDDPEVRCDHGRYVAQSGKTDAEREAGYALIISSADLAPDDPEAWARAACSLRMCGGAKRSFACIQRALDLEPENPDYLHDRGSTYELTAPDEAIDPEGYRTAIQAALADIEKAISLTKDEDLDCELHRIRADLREGLGDIEGAMADQTYLIEAAPHYEVTAFAERARLRKKLGDMEGAREDAARVKVLEEEVLAELAHFPDMMKMKRFNLDEA